MGRRELFDANTGWMVMLSAMVLTACGGCWEEIEYTGQFPSKTTRRAPPPAAQDEPIQEQPMVVHPPAAPPAADVATSQAAAEATDFGEDLAQSLPEPELTPLTATNHEQPPAEPAAAHEMSAASPEPDDDRYATPTVETSANYASADTYGVEDTPPIGSETESPNTQLAAWQLGGKLSLAALANDRGVAADKVQQWMADCKSLAESLGTTMAELPQAAVSESEHAASREVLNYILSQGQRIGRDLNRGYGALHPALFEVAMKSNLLRVLYEPNSTATEKLAASIANAAHRAELPAELWQPLLDSIAAKADLSEMRKAVLRLHTDVERHLAGQVER